MVITFERLVRFETSFQLLVQGMFFHYYIIHHYNVIKIKEDMAFENVDYEISRKLEVRF